MKRFLMAFLVVVLVLFSLVFGYAADTVIITTYFVFDDGSTAAPTSVVTIPAMASYTLVFPVVEGYGVFSPSGTEYKDVQYGGSTVDHIDTIVYTKRPSSSSSTPLPPPADSGGSSFAAIGDFIKGLFIPSADFFPNQMEKLNNVVNEKLGGISYLYNLIKNFFNGLSSVSSSGLNFAVPDNYFFPGYKGLSLDVFSSVGPYLAFLKSVLNVFVVLVTAFACYKHLITLFHN